MYFLKNSGMKIWLIMTLFYNSLSAITYKINPALYNDKKTVIFDLGDVVFTQSTTRQAQLLIPIIIRHPSLIYTLYKKDIKSFVFDLLKNIPAQSCPVNQPMFNKQEQIPQIMVDWMIGRSNDEIIQDIYQYLETSLYSYAEKKLLKGIILNIFKPDLFINCVIPVDPMVMLIKGLKKEGYKLYILSNWDETSFNLMRQRHSPLFDIFDGILISGSCKIGKPNHQFYNQLLQEYNLDPATCVFIDDEPFNIKAAQELGICGIIHESLLEVCKELEALNILTKIS